MIALLLCIVAWAVPTVAIADLANQTGDATLDGAGPGVAGILVSRFQQTDAVRVIERDALVRILSEQQLGVAGLTDPSTAARAGRLVGAEYLVVGEIFSAKLPAISVALRVVDTETGEVVASRDVVGEVGDKGERFFTLVDELSDSILDAMQVELDDGQKLSEIEQRELAAVLRFGEDLLRVNNDHPMALFRESDKDFRTMGGQKLWMVYENSGAEVPMPQFARRIGDDQGGVLWAQRQRVLRRKAGWSSAGIITYGIGGLVVAMGAGSWLDPETQPGPVLGLRIGGAFAFLGSFCHLIGNGVIYGQRMQNTRYPGLFYQPHEADRWIADHNRALE